MNAIKLSLGDFIYKLIEIPFKTSGKSVNVDIKGYDYEKIEVEKLELTNDRRMIMVNGKYPFPAIASSQAKPTGTIAVEWYVSEEEVKDLITGLNKVSKEILEAEITSLMEISESLTKLSQPKNFK